MFRTKRRRRFGHALRSPWTLLALLSPACVVAAADRRPAVEGELSPAPAVLEAESLRAAAVRRASAATVAVFDASGSGGGSAVLISADGFALTNFHVVAGSGAAMKCGLNDGKLYDAVVVGIDPVGDLALIQLLGREDFPTATIGDSDRVQAGDDVFAAGNPFLLADDFTPTISCGIISGVHRYQFPSGTLLEYCDCLQTDAAINPGNSGGPLFDAQGRLVGVNGRCSFEKRGRVNVGVGYAISINQAMRFLSHLKSGRIVDHASLGATASTGDQGVVAVDDILETSDAFRRGLAYGDQIVRLADREIRTANALKNVLGTFPPEWRVPLVFRRDGRATQCLVRLGPLHDATALAAMIQRERRQPLEPAPERPDREGPPQPEMPRPDGPPSASESTELPPAVAERYEARPGFSNYWYNRKAQERLFGRYVESSAVDDLGYDWQVAGRTESGGEFRLATTAVRARWVELERGESGAVFTGDLSRQLSPPRSGGLLLALHAWQEFVAKGLERYGEVVYLGRLPHGSDNRIEDCLSGYYGGMETRFYFAEETGALTGIELFTADDADPCELTFSEYVEFSGRRLPRRWTVQHAGQTFSELVVESWAFESVPLAPQRQEN
jgi:S1-C subfamily serine protease